MKKILLLLSSAALIAVPFASPAAADATSVCETGVIVHEGPSYGTNPIYVETGRYEPYTNCLSEPPIVIHPVGLCLTKPRICV